ncbi:MAG TPA: DEAD/DEAH box helicase [Anaerolineales bacterium]|nr:DEAD/DEAH box helicase [Anaerolineales bacterium]
MAALETLNRFRLDRTFMDSVTAWERQPARPAREAPFPQGLDGRLATALAGQGIQRLYTHQAAAAAAALGGAHVVTVTGTASGKTLGYNLPVLHTLLGDPGSCALYLFPTKALAQDQADELAGLMGAVGLRDRVHVYDGDTPQARRGAIRKSSGVLISNPDMLHAGLLPHHPRWAQWLANLKYVVLDELHVYRGLFGSHMANVLRRLRRICAFYGAEPQFLCASATIANPQALAERLIEAPVIVVDDDGAPRAEKHVLVYNPPVLDAETGVRRSYLLAAQEITTQFLRDDVQTALFARSRAATEILLGYLRESAAAAGVSAEAIRGYRGGYLPLERREIERGLREGEVRGVVATNALELGVDIGRLGAVVIAGYPGTIASTWQQAGRAGRRAEASAVVLVGSSAPLDQYLATHPRYLFSRSPEHALINPDNLLLLASHLRCAVFELPFAPGEGFGTVPDVSELLDLLVEDGEVHAQAGTYRWVGDAYPAEAVSLRTAGQDRVLIQAESEGRPRVIGEVDRVSAPVRVYEHAVYLHDGRSYLIDKLDWDEGIAHARPAEVDYFTEASEAIDIAVLRVADSAESLTRDDGQGGATLSHAWGDLKITAQAATYRMVRRHTHETLGHGEIALPERDFQTTGYWMWFPEPLVQELARAGLLIGPNNYGPNWERQRNAARARDGLRCRQCGRPEPDGGPQHAVHHIVPFRSFGYIAGINENYLIANQLDNLMTLCAACHQRVEAGRGTQTPLGGFAQALSNVAPLYLMCDPRDLGFLAEARARETGAPTITFYDSAPEGLGLAEQLFALRRELIAASADLIRGCGCRDGCPACVGPVGLEETRVKELALQLATRLAGG